jgi:hypothetical protein
VRDYTLQQRTSLNLYTISCVLSDDWRVRVQYAQVGARSDEWVPRNSPRLQPFHKPEPELPTANALQTEVAPADYVPPRLEQASGHRAAADPLERALNVSPDVPAPLAVRKEEQQQLQQQPAVETKTVPAAAAAATATAGAGEVREAEPVVQQQEQQAGGDRNYTEQQQQQQQYREPGAYATAAAPITAGKGSDDVSSLSVTELADRAAAGASSSTTTGSSVQTTDAPVTRHYYYTDEAPAATGTGASTTAAAQPAGSSSVSGSGISSSGSGSGSGSGGGYAEQAASGTAGGWMDTVLQTLDTPAATAAATASTAAASGSGAAQEQQQQQQQPQQQEQLQTKRESEQFYDTAERHEPEQTATAAATSAPVSEDSSRAVSDVSERRLARTPSRVKADTAWIRKQEEDEAAQQQQQQQQSQQQAQLSQQSQQQQGGEQLSMPQQVANNMSRSLGNAPQQEQQRQQQGEVTAAELSSTDESVQVTPEELAQARSVDEQQEQLAGYGVLAPRVPTTTGNVSSSSSEALSSSSNKPVEAEPAVAAAANWVQSVQGTSGGTTDATAATGAATGTTGAASGSEQAHKDEHQQQQGGLLSTLTNLVFGEKGHHSENDSTTAAAHPAAPKA